MILLSLILLSLVIGFLVGISCIWLFFYLQEYSTLKILKHFGVDKKNANQFGAALAFAMQDAGVLEEYKIKSLKEKYAWAYINKELVMQRLRQPSYLQQLAW